MKHIFAILLFYIISLPILADSISHRKVTEEMLLALNFDSTMTNLATNVKDMRSRELKALELPDNAKPIIDEYLVKINDLLFSSFKWENVKNQYIDAYVSVYSEREIKDLLVFFRSKLGKKYIEQIPKIETLESNILESKIQDIQPQMQALNEELKRKISNAASNWE